MLDATAYLAHNMHVRVTGALADNTAAPYYCLLLCVNSTLEDSNEYGPARRVRRATD